MESAKRIVILLIVVLLTSAPAQSADKPAATSISNTRTASCIVKITSDPLVLPLDDATIDYLLHSTGVGGKVSREVLDISPDEASNIFKIEPLVSVAGRVIPQTLDRRQPAYRIYEEQSNQNQYDTITGEQDTSTTSALRTTSPYLNRMSSSQSLITVSEQTILLKLQVNLPENVKPIAEEFMDALVDSLQTTLVKAFNDYKRRAQEQLKLALQEVTRAEADLRKKQKTLRDISGTNVLNRDKILADINRLRQDIQIAKMNVASNQVIIADTTKRIAEIQAKIEEKLESDPLTTELQTIVEMSGKLVDQAEKEVQAGRMPGTQLEDIKEKFARARIELARRREELGKSAGGTLIETLNKELATRSIQATQDEASLSSLERQLTEAKSLLIKTDDYELLALKTEISKQSLQETMLLRDRMSRQIRLLKTPMVSILGGS